MPSVLLTESIALELGALEPWPQDVKLYQPYEAQQILLPDHAGSVGVQAFLKMCSLDYQIEMKVNAESMSPSGKIPFIRCGAFVVAEMEPIVAFVGRKGIHLSDNLDNAEKADMRAYMALVSTVLVNAELFISWFYRPILDEVTKPRYGHVYPWPLNFILCWKKRRIIRSWLASTDWLQKSLEEVYEEVRNCCQALSERLGTQQYFFKDRPTELDALVFGHLFAILATPLPNVQLSAIVRTFPNLMNHCRRIESTFFTNRPSGDVGL